MFTSYEMVRRRFGDQRPGLHLVSVVDAAVPVTVLRVDVLAQERKPIQLLDEFVLRFVLAGVLDVNEIASLLGLQREQVVSSVADQISSNNLVRSSNGHLRLTDVGLESARDLAAVQPVLTQLPVHFDRLVWEVHDYPRSALIKKRDAQERGLEILPAKRSARINTNDLTVERFNEILSNSNRDRQVEVLRVRKIASQSQHVYMPAQLLVYGDPESGEVELGLCIDGELRPAHGLELAAANAVASLGISVGPAVERPTLSPDLEDQRVGKEAVGEIQSGKPSELNQESAESAPRQLEKIAVRSVDVHEHPGFLSKALTNAKQRILIIAPWVKNGVVNTDFLASLERRLKAGVEVHIGHGYGPDDRGSDEYALRRLANLATRYPKLQIVRLENTHAKILIFDAVWITTSFNWLSFRGDPNRTYRMEEGTLVQIGAEVDRAYNRYVTVLAGGGVRPAIT